jgi:hypothetical protein
VSVMDSVEAGVEVQVSKYPFLSRLLSRGALRQLNPNPLIFSCIVSGKQALLLVL